MNTDCQESNPRHHAIEAAVPALAAYSIWVDTPQKFAAYLRRSSEFFSTWLTRQRHWRALDRLSDHTLRDIGLGQVDIDRGWKNLL